MTTFHESIKSILAEVEKFLSESLKKEKLSKKVAEHKQLILEKIINLQNEYPQLKPAGQDTDKNEDSHTTGGSNDDDAAYADSSIAATPVSELVDPLFDGFLEKKQNKKGLFNKGKLQKRWCIIKNGIFYYYENKTDKKQHGAFKLDGYAFSPAHDLTKEAKKKELGFEVTAEGKRTYQFVAPNKEDFEKWKVAVSGEDPNQIAEDVYEAPDDDVAPEPEPIAEDIYEDTEDTAPSPVSRPTEKPTEKALPPPPPPPTVAEPELIEEDIYEDQDNLPEDLIEDDVYEDASSAAMPSNLSTPSIPKPLPSPTPQPRHLPPVPSPGHRTLPEIPHAPPPVPGREKEEEDAPPPPPVPRSRPPNVPLPPTPKEPKPKKRLKISVTCKPDEDFENKFYGKWDCTADNEQELSFKKGDIIHIINRDYDEKGWWVGELKDKFGLVPKNFLTPAYKLAPGQ